MNERDTIRDLAGRLRGLVLEADAALSRGRVEQAEEAIASATLVVIDLYDRLRAEDTP